MVTGVLQGTPKKDVCPVKYLRVLLTKYPGRFSRLLALLSGRGFTHASIGLEGDGRFYSFSFRGFTEETARRADYRYSYIGVALCLLRLPFHWKNRYFCSQFVAELLSASGAVPLRKAPSLYLPNHFPAELDGMCQVIPSPV